MALTTPFQAVHEQFNANFAEYDAWQMPSDFGDIDAELKALATHCVAFDLSSFGRISISGPGCDELIDKILADKTSDLEDGKWVWAIITGSFSISPGLIVFVSMALSQRTLHRR